MLLTPSGALMLLTTSGDYPILPCVAQCMMTSPCVTAFLVKLGIADGGSLSLLSSSYLYFLSSPFLCDISHLSHLFLFLVVKFILLSIQPFSVD